MSFQSKATFSSRVTKSKKPPAFKRSSSGLNPYSALARRKPIQRSATKPETVGHEDEDHFGDRLDDMGLVRALATDLTLRDVPQAMVYVRMKMWSELPERAGMNSVRIAEVLNYRVDMPPAIVVSHLQALLSSPTAVEKEIAEMMRKGAIRKIVIETRGHIGELLILAKDLEQMIEKSSLAGPLQEKFIAVLHANPTALKLPRSQLSDEDVQGLMRAGFLTLWTPGTTFDSFSRPGDGSRGTATSLESISKAASGSMSAVGGENAVFANGGGGGPKPSGTREIYSLALPNAGPFLKVLSNARAHLISLLSKSKYREAPESMLRQRWDGGIAANDFATVARRNRGEFAGVLPGRTRKWKQFYGLSFEFILGECVGAGLVEVFNTGSVGRGIRALH
ncbi:serine-threonine protein kinase 19-domain-containing protein [Amylocarpus encephaloides]|uniref:Serine-threonine protein kinase 19-domain-containing protein n=1 Tax=Amylocarpus encephaloides TaxID=45428 RepID=A0A9P7YNK8_9HELO|nr:serine-threonine protein kinase 19-domain-containing protein [Amylocarpus encephaloides]